MLGIRKISHLLVDDTSFEKFQIGVLILIPQIRADSFVWWSW